MKLVFLMVLLSFGSLARAEISESNANSANSACNQVLSEKVRTVLRASFMAGAPAKGASASPAANELARKYDHLMSKIERSSAQSPSVK